MTHLTSKQARNALPLPLLTLRTLLALLLFTRFLSAAPTGSEILASARDLLRAQDVSLTGKLRTGPKNVPFQLTQHDGTSTYTFREPSETITVALGPAGAKLSGLPEGKSSTSLLRGSVLSYDDLTLRFLYWTTIEDLGIEKLRSLPCWKLRLDAPDKTSPYAFVKLWVNQQSNAFIRAQAFDWKGVLAKQFDVISTQSIGGRYFLKSMKIQLTKPSAADLATLSYLEIDKPN